MNAFDLYLSSRDTTVNNVSRAGRTIARCIALNAAWSTMSAASDAEMARPTNPNETIAGSKANVTCTPSRFINRPVTSAWSTSVVSWV